MQKQIIKHQEIKLIGIKVRTSLNSEMNPSTAKISAHWRRYMGENIAQQIQQRRSPGVTYAVYTNYASDEYGEYDCFIGEEVSSFDNIPEGLLSLTVPAGKYIKFTTAPGKMPTVVIDAWQQIWQMTKDDQLGGQRTYKADFEVYDHRAADPANAVLDIYLGVK